MASDFPGTGIDSFTTKQDGVTTVDAAHVNDLQEAVVAVQTKVGIDGGAVGSIDELVKTSTNPGHIHDTSTQAGSIVVSDADVGTGEALARKSLDESITGDWTFTGVLEVGSSALTTHDVRVGSASNANLASFEYSAVDTSAARISFYKSRNGAAAQAGDNIGVINYLAHDGVSSQTGAQILIETLNAWSNGVDNSTSMVFRCTSGTTISNRFVLLGNGSSTWSIDGTNGVTMSSMGVLASAGTGVLQADRVEAGSPSSNDSGTPGDIRYDSSHLYICTGATEWKRVHLSSFN